MIEAITNKETGSRFLARPGRFHDALALIVGIFTGWIAWGLNGQIWQLGILILLPYFWGSMSSRRSAWLLSLGYFLAGTRGLPAGAAAFFGDNSPLWWGVAMWLCASLLLSAPFYLFWSQSQYRRAWGFIAAVLVTTLPPLGIIGWVNPLNVAGLLFPSGAWLGLVCCVLLFFFLATKNYRALSLAFLIATAANIITNDEERVIPDGWAGQDTHFAGVWSAGANQASQLLASMDRARWLSTFIATVPPGQTVVLPETILGRWDGVIEALLYEAESILLKKGSRVLVGAELANDHGGYKNALLVLGAHEHEQRLAVQSMPVPISMWKPWASNGAEADFLGRGNSIEVGPYRLGVSICYEQLIMFSMLRLMLDKPEIIAAVSNVWWATQSNIPLIQAQSISALSRLFSVPVIFARNI